MLLSRKSSSQFQELTCLRQVSAFLFTLTDPCQVKNFLDGLPPLGQKLGSSSDPVENVLHEPAELREKKFEVIQNIEWHPAPLTWTFFHSTEMTWASETDIQNYVQAVIADAIAAAGLQGVLKATRELSVFRLRPDIWVLVKQNGIPIGVVEVKKPGGKILESGFVFGQIYDYLLRLKSFHGLKFAFGIVATYNEWRIFWLPEGDEAAATTVSKGPEIQATVEDESELVELDESEEESEELEAVNIGRFELAKSN